LAAYRLAVNQQGKGATIIAGVMSDRATDRHARAVLRQATALGRFDAGRAFSLGIIDEADLVEASGVAGDTLRRHAVDRAGGERTRQ